MTDDGVPVDPPVIVDGELVVECTACHRRQALGTDIDAVETDTDGSDWTIEFTPTGDGRLAILEAYCPNHGVRQEIDDLARTAKQTSYVTGQVIDEAEKLT